MCVQIKKMLSKKFENNRVVFWYDKDGQFSEDFQNIELDDVKKLAIGENEFVIKYQILRQEPNQKFLLYKNGEKPDNKENWLLDILLANDEFQTEVWAITLSELGLGSEYSDITKEHAFFFNSKDRTEKLKELLNETCSINQVRMKMLFVITKTEGDINAVVSSLLQEYANGETKMMNVIQKSNLDKFLFSKMDETFGYHSNNQSIKDFIINAFKWSFAINLNKSVKDEEKLSNGARIFLNQWKNDSRYGKDFEKISNEVAEIINAENIVYSENYKDLVDADYFEVIDKRILTSLIDDLGKRTINPKEIFDIIAQRKSMRWYKKFENLYLAVWYATQFIQMFDANARFDVSSIGTGIENYVQNWYKIDLYYRKFIFNIKASGHIGTFGKFVEDIENLYSNKYLLNLNDNWQQQLDKKTVWEFDCVDRQRDFYKNYVANSKSKLCIIVSDALRYEIGDELASRIRQEDRFEAKLNHAITGLPSYTQLGMASVLPHDALEIIEKDVTVLADNVSTSGLDNRNKILSQRTTKAIALKDTDVVNSNIETLREIVKNHDVIYIFHNKIDEIGHALSSEEQAFEAAEATIEELMKIVKKFTNANINNVLITADHGFIYQNKNLDEDEFLGVEPVGEQIFKKDRRFVIGRNLKEDNSFMKFDAKSLGLLGDLEFQFPKSINRLRLQGAARKFVHGGVSLQEVIIPIIAINKKRQSDTSKVEVEAMRSNDIISSNQLVVTLYQKDIVSDKVQRRVLTIGLYNKNGELISESKELLFDSTSTETRDREQQVTLLLNKNIDNENNQTVYLKLQEPEENTTYSKDYKQLVYTVRKTFTMDF